MRITYTLTDESPALATYSFLPIVKAFLKHANIEVEVADISLSSRILTQFNESLKIEERVEDGLGKLGKLVEKEDSNIIKTPNISASIPQLKQAIKELQNKGYNLPPYPDNPQNEEEKEIKEKYQKALGSAVNPVLRQGNSDRRCAKAVKKYAMNNPYKIKEFNKNSKTRVSYMKEGDFFSNEKAILIKESTNAKIIFVNNKGNEIILKENIKLEKNEILDATFMDVSKLIKFYEEQIEICKSENILFSLHLKTTMMKVSDPIIFGYAIKTYFKELFLKFNDEFEKLEINPNNGISEILNKAKDSKEYDAIIDEYQKIINNQAKLSMVDSNKGITNLHVPSDVIVDASMPAMIRNNAQLWDKNGESCDANAIIPDKTYATIYEAVIEDLHEKGVIDPSKIGSMSNIGLMARKAQEYGSHDKTFVAPEDGYFKILDSNNNVLLEHKVRKNDIYRANQTKYDALQNWINLGIQRAKDTKTKAIFWLDESRASNKITIDLVKNFLKNETIDISILDPKSACKYSLSLLREGKDVISITGNVLRDYLTDLFPILELGTSAKMLSIVPMLNGGAMFETGAGGSAPKQVIQLIDENHLRWDSLGEFLALQESVEFHAKKTNNARSKILASSIGEAIEDVLNNNKSPSRKVNEDDNRTSHFYFALYLAKALGKQNIDSELSNTFKKISNELISNESLIYKEFIDAQNKEVDLGGYYKFDEQKAVEIMRPSKTFNKIINGVENL